MAFSRGSHTLTPGRVVLDDLVDERDVGVAAALRFANEVGIATLIHAEERDVQHTEPTPTAMRASRTAAMGGHVPARARPGKGKLRARQTCALSQARLPIHGRGAVGTKLNAPFARD